jgi:acyl-CoA synthetase (AMP-forming)/AMP-acid ligase II
MNFGESLIIQSFRYPDKIAIKDDTKSVTYSQLNYRVNSLAHSMLDRGLKKGDIICQLQGNTIEHIELLYAIAKTGLIRLPLNPRANKAEFIYLINSFEPAALVFENNFAPVIAEIRPHLKCSRYIYVGSNSPPDTIFYDDLATKFPIVEPGIEIEEDEPYLVQSTSGTTGLPKAALLSHGGMIRRSLIRAIDLSNHSNGIYLAVTALSNTASVFYGLSQLYLGGTVILRNKFDPIDTLETIEKEGVTNISMVPVMWERVLEVPSLKEYNLNSLEIIICYGAPLHSQARKKLVKHVSHRFFETYGITETGPIANLMPHDQLRKVDCVGQPTMHTKIKIIDNNGKELPPGKDGEIVVLTPYLFTGYLKNPKATAEVLKDGWFYTGDTGHLDGEHYLYIMGRSKDMIISGGYNIYAEEVERVIAANAKVQEVAVIGVPDGKWGEAVKAIVVLKLGAQATEEEIIDFCKANLASYKKPQSVDFTTSLPRIGAEKIAKQKLREMYWAGFEKKVH